VTFFPDLRKSISRKFPNAASSFLWHPGCSIEITEGDTDMRWQRTQSPALAGMLAMLMALVVGCHFLDRDRSDYYRYRRDDYRRYDGDRDQDRYRDYDRNRWRR
jgi:hypothetical protein